MLPAQRSFGSLVDGGNLPRLVSQQLGGLWHKVPTYPGDGLEAAHRTSLYSLDTMMLGTVFPIGFPSPDYAKTYDGLAGGSHASHDGCYCATTLIGSSD